MEIDLRTVTDEDLVEFLKQVRFNEMSTETNVEWWQEDDEEWIAEVAKRYPKNLISFLRYALAYVPDDDEEAGVTRYRIKGRTS